jgi:uncharacterized protein YbbC (DUF1343 family)
MAGLDLPEHLRELIKECDEDGKKFACVRCDKKYMNFYSVKQHVMEKHSEKSLVSCLIRDCGEKFQNLNQMRKHCILVHGEGPQLCPSPGCDARPPGISRSVK